MEIKDLQYLASYKATSREKAFGVAIGNATPTYMFADVEENDEVWDPTSGTNFGSILSSGSNSSYQVIHNLYDTSAILWHSIAARRHIYPYLQKFDYQHIYKGCLNREGNREPQKTISLVQAQNTFYALTELGTLGHTYVNDDYYSWLARDNGYAYPVPSEIKTLLYRQNISSGDLSGAITSALYNIGYNTLIEVPGNVQQDYQSGAMYGTAVKCKNQYDHDYSMRHSGTHIGDVVLSGARDYYEVCNCNDQVYLKYRDVKAYSLSSTQDSSRFTFDSEPAPTVTHGRVRQIADTIASYKIPHIEYLTNINRGAAPANHKSSLYSLTLKTKFLKTSDLDPKIKGNIRLEIKNCIRQIVQKIAPANTQLFSVSVS